MTPRKKPEPEELSPEAQFTRDVDRIVEHLEKMTGTLHAVIEPLQELADHAFEQVVELRKVQAMAFEDTLQRVMAKQRITRALDRARRPVDEDDDGRTTHD